MPLYWAIIINPVIGIENHIKYSTKIIKKFQKEKKIKKKIKYLL